MPAKVNVVLDVGPLRPDGFHDLTTVFQAISLFDVVTAEAVAGDEVSLRIVGEGADELPLDDGNLAVRAVRALAARTGHSPGVRLTLEKSIPVAGGLAGGSADAAGALLACDTLWGTGLGDVALAALAADLGSDVPFALHGGTALGTGRGETLVEVLALGTVHWVLGVADGGLSTPAVYAELDASRAAGLPQADVEVDAALAALRSGEPAKLALALGNSLSPAACRLRPALTSVLAAGMECGALAAQISGSGPTVMFLVSDSGHGHELARRLTDRGVIRKALVAHGPVQGARVLS